MPRYAYVNRRYVPHAEATVQIEDRGFQFADGVYEVVAIVAGQMIDREGHMTRLARSLAETRIPWPMSRRALDMVMEELIRRNRVHNGTIYLQITRGVAPRDFKFPKNAASTLVLTTKQMPRFAPPAHTQTGVAVITIPDIRWKRRDIKSVSLLPNVLGKQHAVEAGAFEAWQVDDQGFVTEGCSSNAWIVTADGTLVTREADHQILNGVTRLSILRLAAADGLSVEKRPFTVAEAQAAREAFLSSATTFATPVTKIDGQPVGDGKPGPFSLRLRREYLETVGHMTEAQT